MKVNLNWLNEIIKLPSIDLEYGEKLSELLEMHTTEVDDVSDLSFDQKNLVVAKVISVTKHPNPLANKLNIVKINVGSKVTQQVVTAAQNVEADQLVIWAKAGSQIIKDGKLIKIEKKNFKEIESNGMLVALQEIGFTDKISPKKLENGIFVFSEANKIKPGTDALSALGMSDVVIETSLTPNRADLLSIKGNAHEVGAILNKKVKEIAYKIPEGSSVAADQIKIRVDKKLAPVFHVRVVNSLIVQESPIWLQTKLWTSGIRPINNVVDITNYMMLLYGQPMHAYDLNKISGRQLSVRLARDEKIQTLDDVERQLVPGEDIVVSAGRQPIMLAGILGGSNSQVTQDTTDIVLEAAVFNPDYIRRTAREHDLHSEASQRFERGINYDDVLNALNHAASLIAELADGEIAQGIITGSNIEPKPVSINISLERINNYLGTNLTAKNIEQILNRLNFNYSTKNDIFEVDVPNRRWDIKIDVDLIEEVGRLYGYENILNHQPVMTETKGGRNFYGDFLRSTRRILLASGMHQTVNYSLTTFDKSKEFSLNSNEPIMLDYPLSQERTSLRESLLTSLMESVSFNQARQQKNLSLFELGNVFSYEKGTPIEKLHLAAVISGEWQTNWNQKSRVDFYLMKGIVENYFNHIDVAADIKYKENSKIDLMHPGRTAEILYKNKSIGFVGQINPKYSKGKKLNELFAFEINLETIIKDLEQRPIKKFIEINKLPTITRDLSLLVDANLEYNQIVDSIKQNSGKYLKNIQLFDYYDGDNLPENKKSLGISLLFENSKSTLTDDQINQAIKQISDKLTKDLNVQIR